jgi:hypothetical protein
MKTRTLLFRFSLSCSRLLMVAVTLLSVQLEAAAGARRADAERAAMPSQSPLTKVAASPQPEIGDGVRMRRFALMAGFNDGGPTRPKLHFALSDAESMGQVLKSLGGVSPDDLLMVEQPTRASFLSALDRLNRLVAAGRAPGLRREVFVYYSGHSDEEGLLIGTDRVTYDELRSRIQAIPAEVRLAILDSCASGAFTRHKGGTRRPPFLLDTSANTRGHAFLTSSAINEVAQESNRIGASFFTHYLVSGLRGAADVNRDRRVTLQEAFQFASQETLAHTEKTRGGPQHAAYEFDLVGTSDLVVTDVRLTQATLALGGDLSGRIGIRDASGNLVVELRKASGNSIDLGLEAGSYLVTMEGGATLFEADVTLALGQRVELARLAFHPGRPLEVASARGDDPSARAPEAKSPAAAQASAVAEPPMRSTSVHLGLIPMGGDGEVDVSGLSFGFIGDRVGRLSSGLQLSLATNIADHGLKGTQLTIGANILNGPGRGAQIATGMNYAGLDFRGTQLSVGLNYTGRWFSGAQIAVGGNIALGDTDGTQIGVGINYAGGQLSGAQIATGANFARQDSHGLQAAVGANVAASSFRGTQISSGANVAGMMRGTQIAPVNLAGAGHGLQLGVVNGALEQSGSQIGVLNLAGHGHGINVGVINVARELNGEAIGVLNLIGNGIHSLAAYATDSMLANLALKLGSRHLYTSIQFGYQPGNDTPASDPEHFQYKSRRYGYGLGIGYRQPVSLGRLQFFEIEASEMNVRSRFASEAYGFDSGDRNALLTSLRLLVGIQIYSRLTAIAGISENVAVGWGGWDLDIGSGFIEAVQRSGKTTVREYPGLLIGVQLQSLGLGAEEAPERLTAR